MTMIFKTIVVPVDLAEPEISKPAVDAAAEIARASGGKITLLYVAAHMPPMMGEYLPAGFEEQQTTRMTDALRAMATAAGLPADKVTLAQRVGGIYHEIIEEAKSAKADLIVMSSHRPAMSTYLLGSNATHVVRHAPCSVMVIRQ
jgi:nucleotide-binding universal stress UspA family protein